MSTRSAIRSGVRVHLRVDSSAGGFGVVSRTGPEGFSVTYDGPRSKGEPRNRYAYPWAKVGQFDTLADMIPVELSCAGHRYHGAKDQPPC